MKRLLPLAFLLLTITAACTDPPPPPSGPGWLAQGAPLPPEEEDPLPTPKKPARPEIATSQALKRVLPKLKKRSKRYTWTHHTTLVPGHISSRLFETEDLNEDKRHHVLTFMITDLVNEPQRVQLLKAFPTVLKRYHGEFAADSLIRILVKDRYEVIIRPTHPNWRSSEKLSAWFKKMRLSELP